MDMAQGGLNFKPGDLVWAKMKRFPPWPGMITVPISMKKPKVNSDILHCIYFFGSNNFGWVENFNIKPYLAYKDSLLNMCKSVAFKEGCKEIAGYQKQLDLGKPIFFPQEKPQFQDALSPVADDSMSKESTLDSSQSESEDVSKSDAKHIPKRKRTPELEEEAIPSTSTGRQKKSTKKRKQSDEQSEAEVKDAGRTKTSKLAEMLSTVVESPAKAGPSKEMQKPELVKEEKRIGILGLENRGSEILACLLTSGNKVSIWNPSSQMCHPFVKAGAVLGETIIDVVKSSDITFSCVSDIKIEKEMILVDNQAIQGIDKTKGFVNMVTTDSVTSGLVSEEIKKRGGRYLEAQIHGGKKEAEDGQLVIMAAGDLSLYNDCQPVFEKIGKASFYFDNVGEALKMNLILQLLVGVNLAALGEGMALAERLGMKTSSVLEILKTSSICCPLLIDKGQAIVNGQFHNMVVDHPVKDLQKDLSLVLGMGEKVDHTMAMTANANELYKRAKRLGFSEMDSASVYMHMRY